MAAKKNTKKKTAKKPIKKSASKSAAKSSKTAAEKEVISKEHKRFWSIVLLCYGILQICLTFVRGAGVWEKLFELNRGLFGMSVFLFAPYIIYAAVLISSDAPVRQISRKIISSFVFILLVSGACQIFMAGTVEGEDFMTKLANLFISGTQLKSGGLAAAVIGWPLLAAFKRVGAGIIVVVLALLFVMLMSNITIPQMISALKKVKPQRENKPEKQNKKEEKTSDETFVDFGKYYKEDKKEKNKVKISETEEFAAYEEKSKTQRQKELKQIAKAAATRNSSAKTKTAKIDKSKPPKNMYVEKDGQISMIDGGTRKEYIYPPISLLKDTSSVVSQEDAQKEIYEKSQKLVETLETFGVKTRIIGAHRGPSVTRFELQPAAGVKVKQITNLADDIALNLAANGVRIEAPIPGKAAIGVEIPNNHRDGVSMRELIDSEEYRNAKGKLNFAVGKNIEGNIIIGDIASMPHMLIAGTTGSGKSVFTNSIIMNILYHASPDEVKLILIDPKKVEFPIYNGIPHLLIPVVTDPLKAAGALSWAVNEMMRRYKLFEANGTKNLEDYNRFVKEHPELERKIEPQILIIVDEFADLMLASKSEVEESVMRLAQLARAAGMHMIIATQSPRVDVLTGIIKANIPSRTALSVANNTDSRVILDETGAEKLLGRGDMLYKPVHFPKPMRIQGAFASTEEIRNVVNFIKDECSADYSEEVIRAVDENTPQPKNSSEVTEISNGGTDDELTNKAITIIVETGNASTAFLQRKLKLGFPRAARIMDEIEEMGIVGPQEGSKPRKVNITKEEWYERQGRS